MFQTSNCEKTISKSSWRPPIVSSVQAAPTLVQVLKKWETKNLRFFLHTKSLPRKMVSQRKTQGIYLFFFGYAAYVPSPLMYCHIYTYVLFHHLFPLCTLTLGHVPNAFSRTFMQPFGLWWCWYFLKSKLQLGTPSTIPSQISQAPTLVPPVYLCQVIFFYPKTRYGIVGMYPKAASHGLNYQLWSATTHWLLWSWLGSRNCRRKNAWWVCLGIPKQIQMLRWL